ncbi:TetR/AcrR family transcriptional regulator [Pleomorphomonas sp. PLEO]|uniref:TetR/AcrR family transcriptional regulator n=1 Tax=Pleomorphomonas sp. PLEO TaxID=3239306 RepID=UPI00351E1200
MKSKPTRGRPREYDPQEALAAALGEFRRRGYTATSLDHLSDATKMARPSLYAAFGNKLEIYRQAVRHYSEQSAERRRRALFEEPSLQKGLSDYFDEIIAAYHSNDGEPLGCPVLSVISGEAAADPEIGAELAAAVGKTDALFLKRMTIAADAGDIPPGADVQGFAAMLAALQHSLALRARAGTPRPELLAIAHAHVALVLKAAGHA